MLLLSSDSNKNYEENFLWTNFHLIIDRVDGVLISLPEHYFCDRPEVDTDKSWYSCHVDFYGGSRRSFGVCPLPECLIVTRCVVLRFASGHE